MDRASPAATKPRAQPSLKTQALKWLANREHSRRELRTKLLRVTAADQAADDGTAVSQIDTLLDQLAAQGLLSEHRFVESRLHARQARFGNRRIELELRQHGVAADAQQLQQLRATELARAREVWRKKFGVPATDAAARARQSRFLSARGFSSEVIHRVVSNHQDTESI